MNLKLQMVLFILLMLGAFKVTANAEERNVACAERNFNGVSVNAVNVTGFLNCIVFERDLSLLAAQWLVLTKSHWKLRQTNSLERGAFDTDIKGQGNRRNAMDPRQFHFLEVNWSTYSPNQVDIFNLMTWLENQVFPALLNGKTDSRLSPLKPFDNMTGLSYESTVYHYLAFVDTPLPQYGKGQTYKRSKGKTESSSRWYEGTLLESSGGIRPKKWKKFPKGWYEATIQRAVNGPGIKDWRSGRRLKTSFSVLPLSVLGTTYWQDLADRVRKMRHQTSNLCLYRQETKMVQALMLGLEHPTLVGTVHDGVLNDFGPGCRGAVRCDYSRLPRIIAEGDGAHGSRTSATAALSFDFSQVGMEEDVIKDVPFRTLNQPAATWTGKWYDLRHQNVDLTKYRAHGLIGRPIWIGGINKCVRNQSRREILGEAPAHYQGQNAIIRDITDDAVTALKNMNGLGNFEVWKIDTKVDGYAVNPNCRPKEHMDSRNLRQPDNLNIKASAEQADKYAEVFKVNGRCTASCQYVNYATHRSAGKSHGSHPVGKNKYFTETIASFGMTLSSWAAFFHTVQPNMRYSIIGYDYRIRPTHHQKPYSTANEHPMSYFNRLIRYLSPEERRFKAFSF